MGRKNRPLVAGLFFPYNPPIQKGDGFMTRLALSCPAATLLLSTLAFAQLDRGTITGTVTDPSGAVVPGTRISIKNAATNATWQTAATSAGDYTAVNLPAGRYALAFE